MGSETCYLQSSETKTIHEFEITVNSGYLKVKVDLTLLISQSKFSDSRKFTSRYH